MTPIPLTSISDIELLRESAELECKLASGRDGNGELPKDFWKSYSALANTNGGIVLLGIKEKNQQFSFQSIEKPDRIISDLFNTSNNKSKVSINLLTNESAQILDIEGNTIIAIHVPRATRKQRPVFLNGNPLGGNCFRRLHEGDLKIGDDEVKLMLAEQQHDSLDSDLLPHYDLNDLDAGTLQTYRQTHTNLNPSHTWSGLDDTEFLRAIGGWTKDRLTGDEGLTKAGLLMFGNYRAIREVFPHFFLDYMERPEAKSEKRWIDRVTFDGTWAGNIYSFYNKVYPKLTADLKVQFRIVDGIRQEDSPVHIALREALANTLVHADYRERAKIYVVKRPDMFEFLNPGLMRIPIETAVEGYESDCRNRTLHEMFRYVNIGEQAGTGIQKILAGWSANHWRKPLIREEVEPNNRTVLELQMLDLFDVGVIDLLRLNYGDDFDKLDKNAQLALAITFSERRLTHARLCELSGTHPSDVSKTLRFLVEMDYLTLTGSGRGAVYRFSSVEVTNPDDVFGDNGSTTTAPSSTITGSRSTISDDSSTTIDNTESPERDEQGRLISEKFHLPFIDAVDLLDADFKESINHIATIPRSQKRMNQEELKDIIVELCTGQFVTTRSLAAILDRGERTLRQDYLPVLCKENRLKRAFPDTPNHEKQAYTKA